MAEPIADMPASSQKEVIKRMAQRDSPEVGVVADDPPVRGMDPAFVRRDRGICLNPQPLDPRREARERVNVIIGMQTSTVLMNPSAPLLARCKPEVTQSDRR